MKNASLFTKVLAVVVSAAFLYGTVYVAGKAWKKSTDS